MIRDANRRISHTAAATGHSAECRCSAKCGDPECIGLARMDVDAFDLIATRANWLVSGDAHGARYTVDDADTGVEILRAEE